MFEKIRLYYKKGYYKSAHISKLLAVGAITQAEYEELITEDEH